MPLNYITRYAAFRRWHQASEDLQATPQDPALLQTPVWVVHFSGRRFNGTFEHAFPSYLCLTLAEARMVVGDVAGPSHMAYRLHFDRYANAHIETAALAQVLQDDTLRPLLHRRLEHLAAQRQRLTKPPCSTRCVGVNAALPCCSTWRWKPL